MLKLWLFAGLGNQLFMIFAIVAYALEKNIDYRIISYKDKTMNGTKVYWDNILKCFKEKLHTAIRPTIESYSESLVYKEDDDKFEYNPIPDYILNENYIINGYFQSYKYFDRHYQTIINMMDLKNMRNAVKEKYSYLFKKQLIAVHFRIGDYIGLQHYHCIKRPEYYIHAIKDIERKIKNIHKSHQFIYFCQDYDDNYVEEYLKVINLVTKNKLTFIRVPKEIDDWEQMLLMSCCSHFIIGNSTFSWFGAYFSEKEDKKVYYPVKWFGPLNSSKNLKDLFPPSWIPIDC